MPKFFHEWIKQWIKLNAGNSALVDRLIVNDARSPITHFIHPDLLTGSHRLAF
jgi:hypothetical protein